MLDITIKTQKMRRRAQKTRRRVRRKERTGVAVEVVVVTKTRNSRRNHDSDMDAGHGKQDAEDASAGGRWYRPDIEHEVELRLQMSEAVNDDQANTLELAAQWIENDTLHVHRKKDRPEIDVFYVGLGKTGSSSFRRGFPDCNTAHFHCTKDAFRHNEMLHKRITNANLNIYDVIAYIARRDDYKPLVAETIREPMSQLFSGVLQHLKNHHHSERGCECMLCDWRRGGEISPEKLHDIIRDHIKRIIRSRGLVTLPLVSLSEDLIKSKSLPHSILGSERFNINLLNEFSLEKKFFYKEAGDVKFLFTRFEEIQNRESLLKSIGYNYAPTHQNDTKSKKNWSRHPGSDRVFECYKIIRDDPDLLKFDTEYIELMYGNEVLRKFYSPEEIEFFMEKHTKK